MYFARQWRTRFLWLALAVVSALALGGCASGPAGNAPRASIPVPVSQPAIAKAAVGPVILQTQARWVATDWSELPGWHDDRLFEAWNAWIKSCEKPTAPFAALCAEVRRLSIATERRAAAVDAGAATALPGGKPAG